MAGRKAPMVAIPRPKISAVGIIVVAGVTAIVVAAASISIAGIRPYGEQTILAQIAREDSILCSKFGLAAATQQFSDCLSELTDLRHRHVDMLTARGWL
jgi:hypothetical protein